jgi:hypothetical protein
LRIPARLPVVLDGYAAGAYTILALASASALVVLKLVVAKQVIALPTTAGVAMVFDLFLTFLAIFACRNVSSFTL